MKTSSYELVKLMPRGVDSAGGLWGVCGIRSGLGYASGVIIIVRVLIFLSKSPGFCLRGCKLESIERRYVFTVEYFYVSGLPKVLEDPWDFKQYCVGDVLFFFSP